MKNILMISCVLQAFSGLTFFRYKTNHLKASDVWTHIIFISYMNKRGIWKKSWKVNFPLGNLNRTFFFQRGITSWSFRAQRVTIESFCQILQICCQSTNHNKYNDFQKSLVSIKKFRCSNHKIIKPIATWRQRLKKWITLLMKIQQCNYLSSNGRIPFFIIKKTELIA